MSFKIPDSRLQIGGRARPRMVSLVETMRMTTDGLRLTAYGPSTDRIRVAEGRWRLRFGGGLDQVQANAQGTIDCRKLLRPKFAKLLDESGFVNRQYLRHVHHRIMW